MGLSAEIMPNSGNCGSGTRLYGQAVHFMSLFARRAASVALFAAEVLLMFGPCMVLDILFMRKDTPVHRLMYAVSKLSERLGA